MLSGLEEKKESIEQLCIKYKVRRLELFGSAARETFATSVDDVDLLVEFESMTPVEHADAYFSFQQELKEILGMPVDLIERSPIRNPYLLESIDKTKVVLYAAA